MEKIQDKITHYICNNKIQHTVKKGNQTEINYYNFKLTNSD